MKKIFYKIKFDNITEIDYETFQKISDVITKKRDVGHGKICAPREEYYDVNSDIANDIGTKMFIILYFSKDNEYLKLKENIRKELEEIDLTPKFELRMPEFIEIFYKIKNYEESKKFEEELISKIKDCGCEIRKYHNTKYGYDKSVNFRVLWQMNYFEERVNIILDFIKENLGDDYYIEYY